MTAWIFSLVAIASLVATPVLAQETAAETTPSAQETPKQRAQKSAERLRTQFKTQRDARQKALETAKNARADRQLAASQDLAEKLIAERVELLQQLSNGDHMRKCRAEAKADATAAVSTAVTRLGRISASSAATVEAVRTLIKNEIVGKNHVYVALLPAVRGMCAADRVLAVIETKINPLIERLASNGYDVAALQVEVDAAAEDAQAAYDAYQKLATDPGTATLRADLAAAKASLQSARRHLAAARELIDTLKTDSSDTAE